MFLPDLDSISAVYFGINSRGWEENVAEEYMLLSAQDNGQGHWELVDAGIPMMRFGSRGWQPCNPTIPEHLISNHADALGWKGICGC